MVKDRLFELHKMEDGTYKITWKGEELPIKTIGTMGFVVAFTAFAKRCLGYKKDRKRKKPTFRVSDDLFDALLEVVGSRPHFNFECRNEPIEPMSREESLRLFGYASLIPVRMARMVQIDPRKFLCDGAYIQEFTYGRGKQPCHET